MTEILWEEPPPRASNTPGRTTKWRKIAAELKANPGRWAVVDTKANQHLSAQSAYLINRGQLAGLSPGEFEAVSRLVDGEARVYARYVGGAS